MRAGSGRAYPAGVYGTSNVCTRASETYGLQHPFVSDMSTAYSGNMGFAPRCLPSAIPGRASASRWTTWLTGCRRRSCTDCLPRRNRADVAGWGGDLITTFANYLSDDLGYATPRAYASAMICPSPSDAGTGVRGAAPIRMSRSAR